MSRAASAWKQPQSPLPPGPFWYSALSCWVLAPVPPALAHSAVLSGSVPLLSVARH